MTLRLPILLAATALAALAALPAPAAGQQPDTVVEIRVQGIKQLTKDAVLANVKTRPGQRYDESVVKADQRRLLSTGRFDSVVVTKAQTPKGVVVTFVVVERPLIAKLQLVGNKVFDAGELTQELDFGAGDPVNKFLIEAGRQALLEKYRAGGYYFAEVALDEPALTRRREVVYRIVEGPKVSVRKIRLEGNEFFSAWRLKQEIGSSARIWPVVAGTLDIEQVERDVQSIRNLYVSEGFLDAEVGRLLAFSEDKRKVVLTFVIREGPRYRVNRVLFQGNVVFSSEELAKRLMLKQGQFFTALKLRRDLQKIQNTYGELGYIRAGAEPRKQFLDPDAPLPEWTRQYEDATFALLNVIFIIKESDQYRIGEITIRGNTVTQDRVVRRQLRFYPEQLFNTVAIQESRKRLLESRLFGEVTISPVGSAPKVRDVLVQIKEGRTAEFMIGVGVSTNSGLLGNVSLTQRNFDMLAWPRTWDDVKRGHAWKGAGQTLRLVAEPGTELFRFYIDWFEPYIFDQPYSVGAKAFVFSRGREDYDETRYGGVFSTGHRFKNRWYGELAARVEGVDIHSLDSDAPPEVRSVAGTSALLGLKGTLVRDRTDSRWNPSTGDRFRLSYEQVTGDFDFGKAVGGYRIYRTLYLDALDRKHVLAGRLQLGNIFGDAPVFERFYGGGIGSIRGFRYRGISPRSRGTSKQIGGEFMVFAGAEYNFPLVGEQLRGVVFLDSGTVEEDFEITTYRISAGVGVRWIIPFFGPVPLSLDFGFPISKDGQDDTQLVSFTIGFTF